MASAGIADNLRSAYNLVMFTRALVLCVVTLLTLGGHAAPKNVVRMEAVVRGGGSKPIPNAYVMLRGIKSEGVWETRTDSNGAITLNVGVGCYHLFASAEGYFPYAKRFCVESETDTPRLSLKLKRDPLLYSILS